ncbi:MAG: DUF1573 domain-containing protein [Bacteroidales bacterium]
MKNLIQRSVVVLFVILFATSGVFAQQRRGSMLTFTKEIADLGTLYTDALEPVKMEIEFTNDGNEPLVITFVRGCCGTRIIDWTKEPVLPGAKGTVTIEFRLAPRPHNVSRTVSVMSNDPDGMKIFRIRGEVAERANAPFGAQTGEAGPRVQ